MDSTALGGADPSAASPNDQAVDRDQSERPTAAAEDQTDAQPPKKKQKRNKPTLSCDCCVERKTKCDRGRPQCLACVKRQTPCHYSEVANLIARSAERNGGRPSAKVRKKAQVQAQLGVVTPNSSEVMLLFITILSIAPLFEALHHYSRDLLTGPSISRAVRWPSIYSPIRSDPSNPSLWIMSGTATPTRP
ncbi:hypothetical protein HDK77DRAFT_60687 [Phyllosticta capitalensis]